MSTSPNERTTMNDPQNDPTTEGPDDTSTPEVGAFGEMGFGGGL